MQAFSVDCSSNDSILFWLLLPREDRLTTHPEFTSTFSFHSVPPLQRATYHALDSPNHPRRSNSKHVPLFHSQNAVRVYSACSNRTPRSIDTCPVLFATTPDMHAQAIRMILTPTSNRLRTPGCCVSHIIHPAFVLPLLCSFASIRCLRRHNQQAQVRRLVLRVQG